MKPDLLIDPHTPERQETATIIAIAVEIYYHNNIHIHTALKRSPVA